LRLGRREGEAARNKSVAGKHLPLPFVVLRGWVDPRVLAVGTFGLVLGAVGLAFALPWLLRKRWTPTREWERNGS
jgi:hypothetical protein